jgi:hypothetical protein
MGILTLLLLILAYPRSADAFSARLRWLPPPGDDVAGYHAYVRLAGLPYDSPRDAGLPVPDSDSTLTFVVGGLTAGRTYHFAVAAYDAAGNESALSRELSLGDAKSCVLDRCRGVTDCDFGIEPDGTPCLEIEPCTHPSACRDPCGGSGVCRGGACEPSALRQLSVRRLRIGTRHQELFLSGVASAFFAETLDPTHAGVALTVTDAHGRQIYRAVAPPGAMVANPAGTSFRLEPAAGTTADSLRRFSLRRQRTGAIRLAARATADELVSALDKQQLNWALQLGDECTRALDLDCVRRHTSLACR